MSKDYLEKLNEVLSKPRNATMAAARYRRVIATMRGVYIGLGGSYPEMIEHLKPLVHDNQKLDGLYLSAICAISLTYDKMVENELEAVAYDRLLWPLKDAYSGFLVEWER